MRVPCAERPRHALQFQDALRPVTEKEWPLKAGVATRRNSNQILSRGSDEMREATRPVRFLLSRIGSVDLNHIPIPMINERHRR